MNTAELERLLVQTLVDPELTKTEKHYLKHWAAQQGLGAVELAQARQQALALAQARLGPAAAPILSWLSGVWDTFQPANDEHGTVCFSPGSTCIQELVRQFNAAKKTCDVCVFTITDNRITEAIEAAHRRGVVVRVISDDEKSHDTGSDIRRLVDNGIHCKTDVNVAHMHHKFAVFDHRILLSGSFNWTRSASEQNEENMIVTPDRGLVTAFLARFEKLWAKYPDYA